MASSFGFTSFSLKTSNRDPFKSIPLSPFPSTIPNQSLSRTLQCRKSFKIITNFQTQTGIFNPAPLVPEPGKSKFIHQLERTGEFTSIDDFNDAIVTLLVDNEPELALQLFRDLPKFSIPPDGWTYSIIIRCHCKNNDPFEAKQVLDVMMGSGYNPNVITFTYLIDSFCRRGRVQRASEVFELMKRQGCKPNVQTYNCLLKGMCFVGRVEEATAMVSKMKEEGEMPDPDLYSYTAVMDGLCKVGRSDEAMELLAEAIDMGLNPSVVTYNSLFNGYSKEGNPNKGFKLLRMMKKRKCEPDYITYSSLLHGLLRWGFIGEAYGVYNGMVGLGLKVDERMMNTLLRALCRRSWKEEAVLKYAYQLFDKMRSWGYEMYPDTHQLVIQTRCIGNEIDEALLSLKEMISHGHFPRMVIINRIIRGLCEDGRIDEAVSVLVLVYEVRRIPSKISFNILIDEFSRRGEIMGACVCYGSALKLGVIPHSKPGPLRSSEEPVR